MFILRLGRLHLSIDVLPPDAPPAPATLGYIIGMRLAIAAIVVALLALVRLG